MGALLIFGQVVLAVLVGLLVYHYIRVAYLTKSSCRVMHRLPLLMIWQHMIETFPYVNDWLTGPSIVLKATWQFQVPFITRMLVVTDPVVVKHILQDNFWNYEKSWLFADPLGDLLGHGIFVSDGEVWKLQRKVASHVFKTNELRHFMTEVFARHSVHLVKRIDERSFRTCSQPFDIQDLFFKFTLDCIGEIAFHEDLGCLDNKANSFAAAFDRAQNLCMERVGSPLGSLRRLLGRIHPGERALYAAIRELDVFAFDIIRRRREHPTQRPDLLSLFMGYTDEESGGLSDHELRDIVMNFVLAGRDTTALALSWAIYELAKNQEIQNKLRQEVLSLPSSSFDDLAHTPYLSAVIKETLRLYPSVPRDGKVAVKDDLLPDGTLVKASTVVLYIPYAMGRLPWLWQNAGQFSPERWLDETEQSPFKFIAFNAGPRLCLGQNMAILEAKVALASLISRFVFTLDPQSHNVEYVTSLTLPIKNGLWVHAQPV